MIGWYQDRAEFGPRALGNRSILAPANPGSIKDRVNAIKQRENFRPFAPAVLLDEMPKYFEFWRTSPYMTFASRVKSNKSESIEAVVHTDGTVRVQTVRPSEQEASQAPYPLQTPNRSGHHSEYLSERAWRTTR